jgi:alkylation response protein AidB-like acyl-CoA dehydrogenase
MRFAFTEDQRLFQHTVRDLLTKECPPEEVRALWSDPVGRSRQRWSKLAEMGVLGLLVGANHGGMAMDEVDLVLLLEETGRVALPEPIVETAAVAVRLLQEAGSAEIRDQWLPAIASGEAMVSVGLDAAGPYVADAHVADLLLLQHGAELHAVAPGDVSLVAQPSVDGARRIFTVDWVPSPRTLVSTAAEPVAAAFDRGALGTAAQLLGIADHMIELTAEYARQREQFGKPIGSFQAVKHLLADALLKLDFARPAVYRAAWSVARAEATRARDVSIAKAFAGEAADRVARASLQIHGAIGYTWEHDLHLWMKKGWTLSAAWGDAAWHRERVAAQLVDGNVSG